MKVLKNFKTYFFRGLAALLPTILTIWLLVQFYLFVQNNVSSRLNLLIVKAILLVTKAYSEQFLINFWVKGPGQITGFVVAFVGICMLGAILASVVGKTLWHIFEKALMRMPVLKKVYPHIKQVTDFFLTREKLAFTRVVAFEYPRKGTWSIGMVTGSGLKKLAQEKKQDFLTIFLPTSPTPFTGYIILVPKEEVIDLNITIEEALRFTISGGVITPTEQQAVTEYEQ
ncbi:MAG: DUF502 domain-containing protein [Planctomycetes bacterium]|nr:DUF502 domain-containing protein [Planctomycetota bacterium]